MVCSDHGSGEVGAAVPRPGGHGLTPAGKTRDAAGATLDTLTHSGEFGGTRLLGDRFSPSSELADSVDSLPQGGAS